MKGFLTAFSILFAFPAVAMDVFVAFESGGHGMFGFNVEASLNEDRYISLGHGITFDVVGVVTPGEISVMQMDWLNHAWLFGSSAHQWEVSVGPAYATLEQTEWFGNENRHSHAWLANANLGYRYQPRNGRMQFRLGATLLAEFGDANDDGESATAAVPYLSIGVRF